MLDHLQQRVIDLLEPTKAVTLSTYGPAGIQAQVVDGAARGDTLYMLVPATTEHLYNLEYEHVVVVTTTHWQLRGRARPLPPYDMPADDPFFLSHQFDDFVVVEVRPLRVEIGQPDGGGFSETIDIEDMAFAPHGV